MRNASQDLMEGRVTMEWTAEEKANIPPRYSCEILIENASMSQAKDSSLPSDAYLIWYKVNDKTYMDVCRGTRAKIFDLYYDKFGPGSVQKIDFGYGRTNPKLWGYKNQKPKKKK
jgi:hypothetical protein